MNIQQIPMSEVNGVLSYNGLDIYDTLNLKETYVQWFKHIVKELQLMRDVDYWVIAHDTPVHFEHHFTIASTRRIIEL